MQRGGPSSKTAAAAGVAALACGNAACGKALAPPLREREMFIGTPSVTLALGAFTATTVL